MYERHRQAYPRLPVCHCSHVVIHSSLDQHFFFLCAFFSKFHRSLKASASARRLVAGITRETKAKLERGEASRSSDLIACLLSLTDDSGARLLSEEEIVDTAMVSLTAGHDTSSILLTFLIRQLANDPDTLAAMVQGT